MTRCLLIFIVCTWLARAATAQGPAGEPNPDLLPPPRHVGPPPAVVLPPYAFPPRAPRLDTREVWQNFGVDLYGRFRPRVILAPQGAYYYYDGTPYPWVTNRSHHYLPYVLD